MELQFKNTISGDYVVIDYPLKENQTILLKECTINWSLNPQIEDWGVRYWRAIMQNFVCTIKIQTIGEEMPEIIVIDSLNFFDMKIESDNYRMHMDYCILNIEIDRIKNKAIGYING